MWSISAIIELFVPHHPILKYVTYMDLYWYIWPIFAWRYWHIGLWGQVGCFVAHYLPMIAYILKYILKYVTYMDLYWHIWPISAWPYWHIGLWGQLSCFVALYMPMIAYVLNRAA